MEQLNAIVALMELSILNVHFVTEMTLRILDIAAQDEKFCLKQNTDGSLNLDHTHAYYYQIQTQIFVCGVEYCDFVIHIERIIADHEFWSQSLSKSAEFF